MFACANLSSVSNSSTAIAAAIVGLLLDFNCSRREAIIVNVCLFYANFLLDGFDFSSEFYALDFLRLAWSKILFQSQLQAAELNWR